MIKFYMRIQNKMLGRNLLYIISIAVLLINVILRAFYKRFFPDINFGGEGSIFVKINVYKLYTYCDIYLLVLFIILIFFYLGTDFKNSMEDISLAIGGSKTNKFMLRKLGVLLLFYSFLYTITFINVYNIYMRIIPKDSTLVPLREVVFYSITTDFFIISLSLFILFLLKDIAVSTSIIIAYYLIEEGLWRCKVMQKWGILGHMYQYYEYTPGEIVKVKLVYIVLSIVLLFLTYKLSQRKTGFGLKIKPQK